MKYLSFPFFKNRSIFLKLLLILLITATISVTIAIGLMGHNIFRLSKEFINQFTTASVSRFIIELGDNPSLEKAKLIAKEYGISIRYEHSKNHWSTTPDFPASNDLHFKHRHSRKKGDYLIKRGVLDHKLYLLVEKGDQKYLFSPNYIFTDHRILIINIMTIIIVVVIFSAAFWMIRRTLKPIQILNEGVIKVSEGHLDTKVPVTNKDELGQLAAHFNQMTSRIDKMLKAKEQLLLDVSHELRSPLTRMKVAMEFLPDSKSKRHIDDDIKSLDIMLTELLESARLDSNFGQLNKETKSLNELLKNTIARIDHHSSMIHTDFPNREIFAEVDPLRLEIVFKNLINNALKYNNHKEPIEVSLIKTDQQIQIVFSDHGKGISEEELPFIFEPFYRVDKSRSKKTGGFGLGLSICKQIIEAHQGSIEIHSQLNRGSRVIILLPH